MKKIIQFACWLCVCTTGLYSQNTIVFTDPLLNNGSNSNQYWSRRGNTPFFGTNNILGTLYNSSIYHYTNNSFKMKLNGDYSYPINGFTVPRNGFLLIGQEQPSTGFIPNYFEDRGAFSRLHLHDNATTNSTYDIESGYRPWMRNGIYFSGFSDAGYLGQKSNAFDNTDMIFTWSDNSGQDNMTFAFTRYHGLAPNTSTPTSGDLTGEGINGREVMRFAAGGNIGMGPRFSATDPPANDLHIRSENQTSSFLQIDNQEATVSGPTGTSVFNGGLFGMLGNNNLLMNGNILLYNQEERHILIGTNFGVNPVSTTPTTTNEKVRITSVGAPTNTGSGYGVHNPFGRPLSNTYVAISSNPANSIQRPYSLLHMGEDVPGNGGYRPWMYHGTLISTGTDQMYIGMKQEFSQTGNRYDAVINWADDNTSGGTGVGADNLRFIFTQTQTMPGPGAGLNGMEVARMTPDCPTCPLNKPSMGIGDYYNVTPANYVGATLDVNGDMRIRTVANDNTLNQILVRDPSDLGRIKYRNLNSIINGNNGIFYNPLTGTAQLGADCSAPTFATDYLATIFTSSRAINLSGNSLTMNGGRVGFNVGACVTPGNIVEIRGFTPNQSGLRFTLLTSASPTTANTGKVLSVDGNGDVILVDNGTANNGLYNNNGVFQLGVDCNNPNFGTVYPNTGLTTDRTLNLNNNQLTFDGGGLGRIGIGTAPCAPINNRLEITGFGANQSGLRFTNLTINSPSFTPAINKYLTVDANGDVVLANGPVVGSGASADNGLSTNPANNVQFGNDLGNTTANLLNDRELNMSGFNIYFKDQLADVNGVKNAIGIGYATVTPGAYLPAKLNVLESAGYIAFPVTNWNNIYNPYVSTIGISGINNDVTSTAGTTSNANQLGVYGAATGNEANVNKVYHSGGRFYAANANANFGVEGIADGGHPSAGYQVGGNFYGNTLFGTAVGSRSYGKGGSYTVGCSGNADNGTGYNYGVIGNAAGNSTTAQYYGGYFESVAPVGSTQYGIYTKAPVGANSNAAWFEGDITVNGTIFNPSDATIKTNITPLTNATDLLEQLNPVTFDYNHSGIPQLSLDNDNHFGLIAQEVETVIPTLVQSNVVPATYDSLGNVVYPAATMKSLNYVEIIPILINGFKEQQNKIEQQDSLLQSMQQQINDLAALITNCCAANTSPQGANYTNSGTTQQVPGIDVKLSDNDCVLNVNAPNPFKDNTVITYTIPETAGFAQIIFYNSLGQAIKIVDINDKGAGRLNVYGEDLRSGMYTYSLIIDGNICETHKMIKE